MFASRRTIGLSLSDRLVQAAEVSFADGRLIVHRAAELELPEGVTWDEPDRAGQELLKMLREHRFTARRAVLGLPARWLLVRTRTLPATDAETMAQTLRLQVEHDFAPSSRELVFDFVASEPSAGERSVAVLVVATMAQRLARLIAAAEAAGLTVEAATSTISAIAALSASADRSDNESVTLHFARTGSEMMLQTGGMKTLRHLGTAEPSALTAVANEVRRMLSQVGAASQRVRVWNTIDLPPAHLAELGRAIGADLELADAESARINANGIGTAEVHRFASAIAVAATDYGDRPHLDFAHSRVAEPKRSRFSRRMLLAAGIGAVFILAAAYITVDTIAERQELREMQARLAEMQPDIDAASQLASDVSLVRQWFDDRPRYLDCMRELTLALPDSPAMWVSNLTLSGNHRGLVAGRTTDQRAVLVLLDRLQERGRFADLQLLDMRDAGRGGAEISFSISFRFVSEEERG